MSKSEHPPPSPAAELAASLRARELPAGVEPAKKRRAPSSPAPWVASAPASFAQVREELAGELARAKDPRRPEKRPTPAPAPRPKPTRSERRARRRAAFLASFAARSPGARPRDIPQRVLAGVGAILRSSTGREARAFLGRMPRTWRPMLEALARAPGDGRELAADLGHVWSRQVIAAAWALWSLGRMSKRNGMRRVVDGYTQGMLCNAFHNTARGRAYSRSRLFGTSYRKGEGTRGAFQALKECGFTHWGQPRTCDANPRFLGPPRTLADGRTVRFAFAVYWVRGAAPDATAPPL